MKKIAYILCSLLAVGLFVGCSDTMDENTGVGRLMLKAEISPEIKVSRAVVSDEETEKLGKSCKVWISNEKGLVRRYEGLENVPEEGIWLTGGQYIAEAWAGDSVPASFDDRYFKGVKQFNIKSGVVEDVELKCYIANVAVSVNYDSSVDSVLTDYTLTVGHSCGNLTWEGGNISRGYFMMNSRDKDLSYTITGKDEYERTYTQTGVLPGVKSGVEYVLNVSHTPVETTTGAAFFTIEIDENIIVIENTITIESAPYITNRYGYLEEPNYVERGNVPDQRIGVVSTAELKSVVVKVPGMEGLLGLENTDEFDILFIHDQNDEEKHEYMASMGIEHILLESEEFGDDMLIIFKKELLSKLKEGEYPITVIATDENDKVGRGTLMLIVTDATVKTDPLPATAPTTWARKATLTGTVLKDNVETAGFNYRVQGTEQWTYVDGAPVSRAEAWVKGSKYKVELTDLTPGTTYEYTAVSGEFMSTSVQTFTTESASPLPNSSFEYWVTGDDSALLMTNNKNNIFWDSGNHGSAKMNKNVTTQETNTALVHSGKSSLKMESQFVGMMGIGAFAAGNVFVGSFLDTEKTTKGILGWGRPWSDRPMKLKGYVKYTPQVVTYSDYAAKPKGDMDEGIIYIAIVDDTKMSYNSSEGRTFSGWPQIVATANIQQYGFKPEGANVIAYGEKVFTEATEGEGLIPFEIELDYRRTDIKASNIIVVASASRYGDYYTGGPSVMYLDDLELVY